MIVSRAICKANNTNNKQGRDRQDKNSKSTWLVLIATSIAPNMIFWFSVGYFKCANDGPKCSVGVGDGSKLEIVWKKVVIKMDFANMKANSSTEKSFGTILVQNAMVMGGCIYPVQNTLTERLQGLNYGLCFAQLCRASGGKFWQWARLFGKTFSKLSVRRPKQEISRDKPAEKNVI